MASIRCGNCHHTHHSARAVRMCYDTAQAIWQIPAAFGYMVDTYPESVVLSMDEAVAHADELAAEQAGEIWAEGAWLRAAENQWDPEDDLERMAEASGLPIPPGMW